MKDARQLAKNMMQQLPTDRQSDASKAAAAIFMEEVTKLDEAKTAA